VPNYKLGSVNPHDQRCQSENARHIATPQIGVSKALNNSETFP